MTEAYTDDDFKYSADKFLLGIRYADYEPDCQTESEIEDFEIFWKKFESFPLTEELKMVENGLAKSSPQFFVTNFRESCDFSINFQLADSNIIYQLTYSPTEEKIESDNSKKEIRHSTTYKTTDVSLIKYFTKIFFDRDTKELESLCELIHDKKTDEFELTMKHYAND